MHASPRIGKANIDKTASERLQKLSWISGGKIIKMLEDDEDGRARDTNASWMSHTARGQMWIRGP